MQSAITLNSVRALVLEDDSDSAEEIRSAIELIGNIRYDFARTHDRFIKYLSSRIYDIASIDWRIGRFEVGNLALRAFNQRYPHGGSLVYSIYPVEQRAQNNGADIYLNKNDRTQLPEKMKDIVRLSLARQIVADLEGLGIDPGTKRIEAERFLQEGSQESHVYEFARRELSSQIINEYENGETAPVSSLRENLCRAGEWRTFDISSYIQLPWEKKIAHMYNLMGFDIQYLAKVMEIDKVKAERLLGDDLSESELATPDRVCLDDLLSICAYLLRTADYEPLLLPYVVRSKSKFLYPDPETPWRAQGMRDFLFSVKKSGIRDAITFIRSQYSV